MTVFVTVCRTSADEEIVYRRIEETRLEYLVLVHKGAVLRHQGAKCQSLNLIDRMFD